MSRFCIRTAFVPSLAGLLACTPLQQATPDDREVGSTTGMTTPGADTSGGFDPAADSTSGGGDGDGDGDGDATGTTGAGVNETSGFDATTTGTVDDTGTDADTGTETEGGSTTGEPAPATPETCQALALSDPRLPDGEYTLYVGGQAASPWVAQCVDMDGAPRAYLLLPAGANNNYAQYTAGGSSPGSNVRTEFSQIAIDEETLRVAIDDRSYAMSSGGLTHGGTSVLTMPYATAMGCNGAANGVARVDLSGTPFIVDASFCVAGFQAQGATNEEDGGRIVEVTGGGSCGWSAPNPDCPFDPFNAMTNASLQLAYAP